MSGDSLARTVSITSSQPGEQPLPPPLVGGREQLPPSFLTYFTYLVRRVCRAGQGPECEFECRVHKIRGRYLALMWRGSAE